MKCLLVLLSFACLSNGLTAQEKFGNVPTSKLLKIQGGYIYDGAAPGYRGANILSIGLSKIQTPQKIHGVELDILAYNKEIPSTSFGDDRTKIFAELNLYKSFALLGEVNKGLFFGPMLSGGYLWERVTPSSTLSFPKTSSGATFGTGFKADYFTRLAERLFIVGGTKLTVLDFGVNVQTVENPTLPSRQQRNSSFDFNFFRPQISFMIGLKFVLRK